MRSDQKTCGRRGAKRKGLKGVVREREELTARLGEKAADGGITRFIGQRNVPVLKTGGWDHVENTVLLIKHYISQFRGE